MRGYLVEVKIDGKILESFMFTDFAAFNAKIAGILLIYDKPVTFAVESYEYVPYKD